MHIIQCYNLDRTKKSKNGWPKAQSPASSRPIPEYSMCSGDAHAPTAQLASSKDGRPLIPRPNSEVSTLAHKKKPSSRPFPASVKGKKNLARVKTLDTSQKNTAAPQIKQCPLNLNPHLSFTSLTIFSNYSNHHPAPLLSSRPLQEMKLATRMEKKWLRYRGL